VPGQGLVAPTDDDTWAIYWSAWQYVCVEEDVDAPIDVENGMPDRQGFGLFARAGFADQDTNPIEWSLSGGIGGRGIIPSRDNDTFGIGYYYTALQSTRLTGFAGVQDHVDGRRRLHPGHEAGTDVLSKRPLHETLHHAHLRAIRLTDRCARGAGDPWCERSAHARFD
jgi:hypothetical protein